MSDTPDPVEPKSAEQPPPQPAADGADDLDSLLSEFDSTAPPQPPPIAPAAETLPSVAHSADTFLTLLEAMNFQQVNEYQRDLQQFNKEDAQATFRRGREAVAELHVSEDFADRWLLAEYNLDPALRSAWDNRRTSAEAWASWQRAETNAVKKCRVAAEAMPDKHVTADRLALAVAVRGASTPTPEGKPPDFGNMSDAELQRWKDENFKT